MKEISSKDAIFTVHIEGREAVELEGVEIAGFTESHPDKILVDRAFMQMAHKVKDLLQQRAELLEALKKYEEARDDLFSHCLSNGVFNAWGKSMNCSNLNDAHLLAYRVISKAEQ